MAVALGLPAQAGEPVDPWKAFTATLAKDKTSSVEQIARLENEYPEFCTEAAKRDENKLKACVAAYRMLVTSAQKDAAVAEFRLAATRTDPQLRDELLEIVTAQDINNEGAVSKRRSDRIGQVFLRLKVARSATSGRKN